VSIDDDFFDVQSALEGTPEKEAFDRWMTYASNLETEVEQLRKENSTLRTAFEILKENKS